VKRITAVVSIALILFGCAPVHRVNPIASELEREDLNRTLHGRRVSVDLVPSSPYGSTVTLRAEGIRVAADSTRMTVLRQPSNADAVFVEPTYGVRRDTTLGTHSVGRIRVRTRWPGALVGLLRGLLVGAASGAFIGAVSYEGPDLLFGSPVESAGFGAALLGTAGAGIGLIGGLLWGVTETYEFTVNPPEEP
jgi:hypothetical protein